MATRGNQNHGKGGLFASAGAALSKANAAAGNAAKSVVKSVVNFITPTKASGHNASKGNRQVAEHIAKKHKTTSAPGHKTHNLKAVKKLGKY